PVLPAALSAVFCALSSAGLPAIVALRLAAILIARLLAVLPLLLARAPLIERRAAGIALALAAVIAVMAPPCVGAKAHAHHQPPPQAARAWSKGMAAPLVIQCL